MEGLKKYGNFHKGGGSILLRTFFCKKGVFKMHFKLFKAILDHVFLHLRGGGLFFKIYIQQFRGWSAKLWKFPFFLEPFPKYIQGWCGILIFDKYTYLASY